jgi:hypothetical protein
MFDIGIVLHELLAIFVEIVHGNAIDNTRSHQVAMIIAIKSCIDRNKYIRHDSTTAIDGTFGFQRAYISKNQGSECCRHSSVRHDYNGR